LAISLPTLTWTINITQSYEQSMSTESKWSLRKSYKDARRRVKDVLRPPSPQPSASGANLPSEHTPSTPTLPRTTQIARPLGSPLPSPLPTISGISEHGVDASTPPLPAAGVFSSSHANLPPSPNTPPPATNVIQTAKDVRSVAWAGLMTALGALKESSGVFPPLKSAVSGLLECLDVLQVSSQNSIIRQCLRYLYSDGLQTSR
jgi:hypothetical protein